MFSRLTQFQIRSIHNVLQQTNINLSDCFSEHGAETLRSAEQWVRIGFGFVIEAMRHSRHFKATPEQILASRDGNFSKLYLEKMDVHLDILQTLDIEIRRLKVSIDALTLLYHENFEQLVKIPRISQVSTWTFLSEIGPDVSDFSDGRHLAK
ncbi:MULTISPECIES: hypothetical protein [Lactococcus]|nr:hypothetical protein [Lactococcus lactis]MDS1012894.1 hypothetical protein [Lactococcus lactis]TKD78616.1 hypothetical protein E6O52_02860 [Lactococcus lactis]